MLPFGINELPHFQGGRSDAERQRWLRESLTPLARARDKALLAEQAGEQDPAALGSEGSRTGSTPGSSRRRTVRTRRTYEREWAAATRGGSPCRRHVYRSERPAGVPCLGRR